MPAYTVAATAVTLEMPLKWVDNVLSHHRSPESPEHVRVSHEGCRLRRSSTLEIALRISKALGISHRAPWISPPVCCASPPLTRCRSRSGQGISLSIDMKEVRNGLLERLAHAVEVAPSPRRGSPHKRLKRKGCLSAPLFLNTD